MSEPQQPHRAPQLDGHPLGGLSCTCGAMAMGIGRATLQKHKPTCGRIRNLTGDKKGGTTLPQVAAVAEKHYGVAVELHVGKKVIAPTSAMSKNRAGRGFVAQGSASATKGTKVQASEEFEGNHAVWVNEGRGWRLAKGVYLPTELKISDPLADGRRKGIDDMPTWWPYSLFLEFCAELEPNGEGTGRLGPGKIYAGFVRDTEPHAHYKHGGKATSPFPDKTAANPPKGRRVNVRTGPSTAYPIVDLLSAGEAFTAYQRTTSGQSLAGSKVWYGDHDGKQWVHESGLKGKGGTS